MSFHADFLFIIFCAMYVHISNKEHISPENKKKQQQNLDFNDPE